MPIYNVVMGQAVSVPNLTGNTLITGIGNAGDAIQSCSAVMLANTITGAAGLYHFPAGSINVDQHSKDVLAAMLAAIQPNQAYIAFGLAEFTEAAAGLNDNTKKKALEMEQLRSHVIAMLPVTCGARQVKATGGVVSITRNGNQFVLDHQVLNNVTNLRNVPAGTYANYRVYGFRLR